MLALGLVFNHNVDHLALASLRESRVDTDVAGACRAAHARNLEHAHDRYQHGSPPGQRREAHVNRDAVEQPSDWACHRSTGGTGARSQPVDLAKVVGCRCGFFDHDEEKRVRDDGGEASDREANVDSRVD